MESIMTQESQQDFSEESTQLRVLTPFQQECQQALLRKERRARNCLLELDQHWNHSDCNKRNSEIHSGDSTINGWVDLDSEQTSTHKQSQDPQHKSTSQTIHLRERAITETSNLIPTLKQELCRLESPRKREKVSGSRLFQLQIMSELNRKRKHSMRVSEIIRCKESRLMVTSAFQKIDMQETRPLSNAAPRLNERLVRLPRPSPDPLIIH